MAKGRELLLPIEAVDGKSTTHISLEVYYNLGGINYFNYKTEPRGIYISASPIGIESRGSFNIRSFGAFTGIKQLVEEAKRRNDKRVNVLFDEAVADFNAKQGPAWVLVNMVLEKSGLALKEGVAA